MTDTIEPTQEVNDPQASSRKLLEKLRFANTLLCSSKIECVELKRLLAACREELEVTRDELASALGEGDALKAERDAALKTKVLGEEQRKLWRCTERQLEGVTDERDYLAKQLRDEVQATLGKVLGAEVAREPKA